MSNHTEYDRFMWPLTKAKATENLVIGDRLAWINSDKFGNQTEMRGTVLKYTDKFIVMSDAPAGIGRKKSRRLSKKKYLDLVNKGMIERFLWKDEAARSASGVIDISAYQA